METKKSQKANLEKSRLMFTQVGLIVSLAVAWMVFETKSYDKKEISTIGDRQIVEVEDFIPITVQEKPKPIERPQVAVQFEIVDDKEDVKDNFDIEATVDQKEAIPDYVPIDIEDEVIVEPAPIRVAEVMPQFPGGDLKLLEFISKNIKYPQLARETGTQGRVYISFVIEPDGSISNVELLRGIGAGCDEEAMRVVKAMPKWLPGRQCGKAVRVMYNLPVNFKLQ